MRGRGRPFNTSTPLGQLMLQRGYTVKRLETELGIGHRVMSDYLAGRQRISAKHLALLSAEFQVNVAVLTGAEKINTATTPRAPAPVFDGDALIGNLLESM